MSLRKFFLAAFALLTLGTLSFVHAGTASAQVPPPEPIKLEVPIPIAQQVEGYSAGKVADLASYIGVMYQFLISIIGLLAALMMIIGGFQYLTSAGDSGKIKNAKKRITDALIGLTLALSAYALLNTINPALLEFKPLSPQLSVIGTELSLLPWCEEVIAQGHSVTPAGTAQACGNIGQYTQDASTLYCMYQGDCRIGRVVRGGGFDQVATCLQKNGLDSKTVKEEVGKDKNARLGVCLPCMYITKTVASELGYGLEDACYAWMTTVESIRKQTPNQELWSYCGPAGGFPGCVQADINCENVNGNEPDAVSDGGCADTKTCGCGGYDDSPEPAYPEEDDISLQEVMNGGGPSLAGRETLDDLPQHLGAVCAWNPCENFVDARVEEGKQLLVGNQVIKTLHQQSFKNGCSGPGISKYVKGVRAFTSDCRNK